MEEAKRTNYVTTVPTRPIARRRQQEQHRPRSTRLSLSLVAVVLAVAAATHHQPAVARADAVVGGASPGALAPVPAPAAPAGAPSQSASAPQPSAPSATTSAPIATPETNPSSTNTSSSSSTSSTARSAAGAAAPLAPATTAAIISQPTAATAPSGGPASAPAAPPAPATTPAAAATTTAATTRAPASSPEPPASASAQATMAPKPDEKDAKRTIRERIQPISADTARVAFNKPNTGPANEFGANSSEARVARATLQFGLNFIKGLPKEERDNAVVSPLSLQVMLSMMLLAASDGSVTERELVQVLGYANEATATATFADEQGRLAPHRSLRALYQAILDATRLPPPMSGAPGQAADPLLLNANQEALRPSDGGPAGLRAALQTNQQPAESGSLQLSAQVNFTMANLAITNEDKCSLKPDYERELQSFYEVELQRFSKPNNQTQTPLHQRINAWVANKTNHQITQLVKESDFDDDLMVVLLNAAHFKGRWLHTFNPKLTRDDTFYNGGLDSQAKQTAFMRLKENLGFAEFGSASMAAELGRLRTSSADSETLLSEAVDDEELLAAAPEVAAAAAAAAAAAKLNPSNSLTRVELAPEELRRLEKTSRLNCSALSLPFSLNGGLELSMLLLLPAERNGLDRLVGQLDADTLAEVIRSLNEQEVQVELPKFALEAQLASAKETLVKMGLRTLFDQAKLERGLVSKEPGRPVSVDKIVHKAKIAVDETGAEAAAVSLASIVMRSSYRPRTRWFTADHPFLFIIRHDRSNMPIFMGRVTNF